MSKKKKFIEVKYSGISLSKKTLTSGIMVMRPETSMIPIIIIDIKYR